MLIYAVYRRTTYLEPSTNLNGEATISIQSVAYRMWRHRTNSHHTRQQVYKCSCGPNRTQVFYCRLREKHSAVRMQIDFTALVLLQGEVKILFNQLRNKPI